MKKAIYLLLALLFCANIFAQTSFTLKISGDVKTPLQFTLQDIAAMQHTTAVLNGKDGQPHSYSGVPLSTILSKAGASMDKDLRGENLSKYLLVKCADGYQVLFSLAELDSSFTDRKVILADSMEGAPLLETKGPLRIVVGGEKKPARSCFQVVELIVGYGKD